MSLYLIAAFVVIGIILLLIEFLIIPGVSLPGIAGFIFLAVAIYFAYDTHDVLTGNLVLAGTFVLSIGTAIFAFRSKTWKRMALETNIEGKIQHINEEKVHPGDEGICISRLNPMGKVQIGDQYYEAKSQGEFITEGKEITVLKITGNTLIVKLK